MSEEQFSRIERLIGSQQLERLHRSRVVVVGLGAVGSYAVEALVRAGVGSLRLVDFDVIRPSNLNRQLYALHSTLGQPKVEVARQRVLDIYPACQVEILRCFAHVEALSQIFAGTPDLMIDAIDSLTPKIELIAAAHAQQQPIISCLGAARRTDPASVRVGPLSAVRNCPLARLVRKRLRSRGVPVEFLCVFSNQPPVPKFHENELKPSVPESEYLERGRQRLPLGSLPTLTGIFGLTAAHAALNFLLQGALRKG